MKRGEVWTVSGGADYTGKPRPAIIIQDEVFEREFSVTVCPTTGDPSDFPKFRIFIAPTLENGLKFESRVMVDKVSTIPVGKVGKRIGALTLADMLEVDSALAVFLGLAG